MIRPIRTVPLVALALPGCNDHPALRVSEAQHAVAQPVQLVHPAALSVEFSMPTRVGFRALTFRRGSTVVRTLWDADAVYVKDVPLNVAPPGKQTDGSKPSAVCASTSIRVCATPSTRWTKDAPMNESGAKACGRASMPRARTLPGRRAFRMKRPRECWTSPRPGTCAITFEPRSRRRSSENELWSLNLGSPRIAPERTRRWHGYERSTRTTKRSPASSPSTTRGSSREASREPARSDPCGSSTSYSPRPRAVNAICLECQANTNSCLARMSRF